MTRREYVAEALWWVGVTGLLAALVTHVGPGVAAGIGALCVAVGLDTADG